MNIYVCIKRVPDTATRIKISSHGRSIDSAGVKYVTSPYDEFALESALRTRDALGTGEVVAVCFGPDEARETLRNALAVGADRAVLVSSSSAPDVEVALDGLATAKVLASALEAEIGSDDLVLLGVKAVDGDQQQVGPMLAAILGRPCATSVSGFTVEGDRITCQREVEGGTETIRMPGGGVLTMTKGPHELRHASLTGIMAAKKKTIEGRDVAAVRSDVELIGLELPPERAEGRVVGQGPEAVEELVRLLRDEAGVL